MGVWGIVWPYMPILFFSLLAAILILCDLHYMGLLPGYQGPGAGGGYMAGGRGGPSAENSHKNKKAIVIQIYLDIQIYLCYHIIKR